MAIGKITSKSLAADAVTSANLAPGAVTISDIPDSEITADKLHTTLDLSTKTLTLTQASVTAHQAALSITQSQISDLSTTSDLAEGTNLYYTDVRADARAQLKIDALVGSAPGTLDTLQELGDALGDDPNFATTVTNSIATKLPLAGGTLTGNVSFGDNDKAVFGGVLEIYGDGTHARIREYGSGQMKIQGDNMQLLTSAGTSTYLEGNASTGAVTLYHLANAPRITTTASGVDVTGTVTSDGLTVQSNNYLDIHDADNHVSGRLRNVSGSNNALAIEADPNNSASDSFINFKIDTNEKMRIRSTGHVEFNPVASFSGLNNSILGSSNGYQYFMGGANGLYLADNANLSNAIGIRDAGFLDFITGGTGEKMRITSTGNVGIGADSPANKLHVKAGASGATTFDARYNLTLEDDGENYIGIYSPSNSFGGVRFVNAASSIRGYIDYYHGTQGDKMQIYAQNQIEFNFPGSSSGPVFKSDGKVGIGVTPDYALDVRGGSSTANGMRVKTGDNVYDGLIVSNSAILKCYPSAGQSVSLQAYNSGGSSKTGVKVTGADTPAGEISTKLEFVTELLGHNVYDDGSYGTSSDQYVDLEDWSPTDFRILEIFGTANPNSGGSGSYADPVHMYVYNGTGWNGAEVTYYVYGKSVAPLARDMFSSGSGSSANVAEVWWYNSSTTAQQDAATSGTASGYHLRLKFPNTNTNSTMVSLKVIKRA